MRTLVTGASGLLGAHLTAALLHRGEVTGLDRHDWWGDEPAHVLTGDLSADGWIEDAIDDARPQIVFHCAAMVNVDACERSPVQAFRANAELPARIARAVNRDCLIVYITTDGVFRGDTPWATEDQTPQPRTVYGQSKLQGEREIAAVTPNHLVVRTNFFGWSSGRKQTSAEWLYDALDTGRPITLFNDFFFTPIYVVDFVSALLRLVDSGARGVFHLAGSERVSKHDFGMRLARHAGFGAQHVRSGSIDDAPLAAPRPKDMSLATARAAAILGSPLPGCDEGIARFLSDRERPLSRRAHAARGGGLRA